MKILINRTDAIGDTLLTLPVIQSLKDQFPHAKIGLIVSHRSSELMTLISVLDQFWVYPKEESLSKRWQFLNELWNEFTPNTYFFIGGDHLISLFSFKKGTAFRGGLISKWPSFLFLNQGIRQSRGNGLKHEAELNLELLTPLGVKEITLNRRDRRLKFNIDEDKRRAIKKEFEDFEFRPLSKTEEGYSLVFIHPGMSGHTLNWPGRYYATLIERLAQELDESFRFVISYTPSDEPYLKEVRELLEKRPELSEKLSFFNGAKKGLLHYAYLLASAKLFVGGSTGTTHMANFLDLSQIAFYSPIKTQSANRWGPLYQSIKVKIFTPLTSIPYDDCMKEISIDEVFIACKNLLNQKDEGLVS